MDANTIFFILLIIAAILSIPAWPVRPQKRQPSNLQVVQGWNVRRKCDGYPLTLPAEEAWDAVTSGEYEFEGAHYGEGPTAGGYFTNDDLGNEVWVPPGFIPVETEDQHE